MGKRFDALTEDQIAFITEQHIFFAATAARDGRVNTSPKGMDALRVLSPTRILWLNLTGSGNETAAHLLDTPRITLMWCSFGKRPIILRAYGTARITHHGASGWPDLAAHLPALPGARQIVDVAIDLVQSSCGYAVPYMEYQGERPTLRSWAEDKGEAGLKTYWAERNATSLDGRPSGTGAEP